MGVPLIEVKTKIVQALGLEEMTPEKIGDDAPLFGTGLGLDSIDALELVVMLEREYGIMVKDVDADRAAFKSVRTLAEFIDSKRAT
jgi:acyl carrier protein